MEEMLQYELNTSCQYKLPYVTLLIHCFSFFSDEPVIKNRAPISAAQLTLYLATIARAMFSKHDSDFWKEKFLGALICQLNKKSQRTNEK